MFEEWKRSVLLETWAQVDADPDLECSELLWTLVPLETDGQISVPECDLIVPSWM